MTAGLLRLRAGWHALPGNLRGALWISIGSLLFALNDGLVKYLGGTIPVFELTFVRYVMGFLLLSPMFLRAGQASWRTERLGIHLVRALIASLAQAGAYYAVVHIALADATGIGFSRALWLTALGVILLKEVVGWRRWAATAVGFVGVLIMVRPGGQGLDPAWLVALAASLGFALSMSVIRLLSRTEPGARILFYYQLTGMTIFVVPAILVWRMPVGIEWPLILGIGVLTAGAMACFVRGFAAGEASVLAPMEYTRLIYAAAIGFFVFGELPTVWTWAGASLIVGATLYIARREAVRQRRA